MNGLLCFKIRNGSALGAVLRLQGKDIRILNSLFRLDGGNETVLCGVHSLQIGYVRILNPLLCLQSEDVINHSTGGPVT